jgi:hypothetical protein
MLAYMKYKKYLFVATFVVASAAANLDASAQIKIGANPTTTNANSLLEMEANASNGRYGMLLPRVALTSTASISPLSAHVQGMMVYNTATAGSGNTAVKPGLYYNDGTQWLSLTSNPSYVFGTITNQNPYTFASSSVPFNLPLVPTSTYGPDIAVSGSTVTLKAGKTYKLFAHSVGSNDADQEFRYYWYNIGSSTVIGSEAIIRNPSATAGGYATNPIAQGLITPAVDTQVALRLRYLSGTQALIYAGGSSFFIEVINQ